MIIAPTKVNLGLVHNIKLDLSALLIGSTSSDNGYSLRRGFQVTYLFGENSENRVFFPFFLKVDQALSQSVDDVSPSSLPRLSGEPREQRGASASGGRRAKNLPETSSIPMAPPRSRFCRSGRILSPRGLSAYRGGAGRGGERRRRG